MTRLSLLAALALVGSLSASLAQEIAAPAAPVITRADEPAPKEYDPRFLALHEQYLKRAKSGPIDVLFLGDSITEGWKKHPEIWAENFEKLPAASFGIGGDRTEHVLWRIDHGELDGISPRVIVLLIGTNNTAATIFTTRVVSHSAPEIASGIKAIIARIQARLPHTKILLLGIFPRGPRPNKDGSFDDGIEKMEKIRDVNRTLATLENGSTIRYLDLTPSFLDANGKIPNDLMPDQLHPNEKGYKIWAASLLPVIQEMMATPDSDRP